jgi:hypothetical protein
MHALGSLDVTSARWPVAPPRMPAATQVGTLVVAALVSALVLGPALGRGVVLAYDLAWSPDPRLTPFALGTSTPAPRAVPRDAAGIVLGWLVGAGVAQALVLWFALVLAGVGAARLAVVLAPGLAVAPRAAAVLFAIWNPFVLERPVVGQWTVLLGYAAVPHLMVACVRVRQGDAPSWSPAVGLAVCGLGGANTVVIGALAVGGVLIAPRPRWAALGLAAGSAVLVSAVWALPAMVAGVTSAASGVAAFAPRADTPLGVLGSLVSGGAFWNPASHPAGRTVWVVAVSAAVLALAAAAAAARAARQEHLVAVIVPAVLGLGVAWLSSLDPFGLWSALVLHAPGGGVLRDAQKLIAPWVSLTAAGAALLARDVGRVGVLGPAMAVLLGALPVVLLPSLAWGVGGRVSAVEVPADLRSVAAALSQEEPGTVGLLPWSQYRRYAWNGDRVSLTLAPRMIDQRVLFNDALPLAAGDVPGEDPMARRVGERLEAGTPSLEALAAEGVRWVLVEKATGLPDPLEDVDLPPGTRTVTDGPHVWLLELQTSDAGAMPEASRAVAVGWAVTSLTWVAAAACLVTRMVRRQGYLLVWSRP